MNREILHCKEAIQNVFAQVSDVLHDLSGKEYTMPSDTLFNASIGQHVRHIIELFMELNKGYESGVVNYEKRKRDYRIETDKYFAASLLDEIVSTVEKKNRTLILEAGFTGNAGDLIQMKTNYYRELAYNIEHTIHHMALIRVGVNELSAVRVDENFGIASATIKHRKACVQ
ncbi:MAG: DinB family protein [Bacteroidota bacterium]